MWLEPRKYNIMFVVQCLPCPTINPRGRRLLYEMRFARFPEFDTDDNLYLSCARDSFFQWLPLTVYLFDAQITYVPAVCICDLKVDIPLMVNFVSFLWVHRPKITSLKLVLLSTNVGVLERPSKSHFTDHRTAAFFTGFHKTKNLPLNY